MPTFQSPATSVPALASATPAALLWRLLRSGTGLGQSIAPEGDWLAAADRLRGGRQPSTEGAPPETLTMPPSPVAQFGREVTAHFLQHLPLVGDLFAPPVYRPGPTEGVEPVPLSHDPTFQLALALAPGLAQTRASLAAAPGPWLEARGFAPTWQGARSYVQRAGIPEGLTPAQRAQHEVWLKAHNDAWAARRAAWDAERMAFEQRMGGSRAQTQARLAQEMTARAQGNPPLFLAQTTRELGQPRPMGQLPSDEAWQVARARVMRMRSYAGYDNPQLEQLSRLPTDQQEVLGHMIDLVRSRPPTLRTPAEQQFLETIEHEVPGTIPKTLEQVIGDLLSGKTGTQPLPPLGHPHPPEAP